MDAVEFTLILPAYNEAAAIGSAIREASAFLDANFETSELIVVDDGSSDDTAAIASSCPDVRVIRLPENRGYGAALRSGFEAARGRHVAFTDADCQFDLNDLLKLKAIDAPIAVGYRVHRRDPVRRRFLSWGYNRLARVWLRTGVTDVDCALKVFRRDVLMRILPESTGFFVNTEMLARASALGHAVVECGVTHRPRRAGTSKVSLLEVPKTLRAMAMYWWSQRSRKADPVVLTARVPRVAGRWLEPVPESSLRRRVEPRGPLQESI